MLGASLMICHMPVNAHGPILPMLGRPYTIRYAGQVRLNRRAGQIDLVVCAGKTWHLGRPSGHLTPYENSIRYPVYRNRSRFGLFPLKDMQPKTPPSEVIKIIYWWRNDLTKTGKILKKISEPQGGDPPTPKSWSQKKVIRFQGESFWRKKWWKKLKNFFENC